MLPTTLDGDDTKPGKRSRLVAFASTHQGQKAFNFKKFCSISLNARCTYHNKVSFCIVNMKPNREKIEAEELVKERLPLTKWELTPKEKEDFNRVMRLMFDAANILRYDLELGEDAILKTLRPEWR
jgi:hypothetical protein